MTRNQWGNVWRSSLVAYLFVLLHALVLFEVESRDRMRDLTRDMREVRQKLGLFVFPSTLHYFTLPGAEYGNEATSTGHGPRVQQGAYDARAHP